MQKIRFWNETEFDLVSAVIKKETLKNFYREIVELTISNMSYNQALTYFENGVTWTIIDEMGERYEWKDYGVSGAIIDNRDNTITVKMGKNNTVEQDLEEKASKMSQDVVTLAGKNIATEDVADLRSKFEKAAAKLSDEDAKIAPSLSMIWNPFQQIAQGERRYYAPNDTLYKCLKAHQSNLSNAPDMSTEYWSKI